MKKLVFCLFCLFGLMFTQPALAADLNFECFSSPTDHCDLTGTTPLFNNSDGVWYPGKLVTKTINLKNSTADQADLKIRGRRSSAADIFGDVLRVSIVPSSGGVVIWSGSLAEFYSVDYIGMGTFGGGANQDYNFAVSMDSAANNDYQGLSSTFDLDLNFASFGSGGDSGGGSNGGGGSVSAPTCDDAAPGSAPTLLSAVSSGLNQVTLNWSAASGSVTYYLVSYRTDGGQQYGNPNVGGAGTTSYTVSNLSGGTTYYFKVRAGNGCMPGAFSGELLVAPLGGVVAGPATGFQAGVLGINSEEEAASSAETESLTPTVSPTGEVKGIESTGSDYWWLLFLGAGGLILIYWFLRRRPS